MRVGFVVVAALLLCIIVGVSLAIAGRSGKSTKVGSYKRSKLMTPNELEFFGRLVSALPDHFIFPQVAMAALLTASSSDKRVAHADRLRISQQRVDFVVCDKLGEVLAVIELDDRTHVASKDSLRDARLESAGFRTVRFQSKNKPTIDVVRSTILGGGASNAAGAHETNLAPVRL